MNPICIFHDEGEAHAFAVRIGTVLSRLRGARQDRWLSKEKRARRRGMAGTLRISANDARMERNWAAVSSETFVPDDPRGRGFCTIHARGRMLKPLMIVEPLLADGSNDIGPVDPPEKLMAYIAGIAAGAEAARSNAEHQQSRMLDETVEIPIALGLAGLVAERLPPTRVPSAVSIELGGAYRAPSQATLRIGPDESDPIIARGYDEALRDAMPKTRILGSEGRIKQDGELTNVYYAGPGMTVERIGADRDAVETIRLLADLPGWAEDRLDGGAIARLIEAAALRG